MPYVISPEERVNSYTQSRQSAPQTVALPDGGYLTIWSGAGPTDLGYGVYLQRYDAGGGRVGGEVLVNTITVYSQRNPDVTVLPSGGYVVTWDGTVPGGGPGDPAALGVFVQAFDAAGGRIGPETQVSGVGLWQRVTALPDGGYVVAWAQHVDDLGFGVLAQRFDASGQAQGPVWPLDQDRDAILVSLTATDSGFLAVWRASNDDGATIAIQAFDADGGRLGDTIHIPRDGDLASPEIIRLADGGFALVWSQADGLYAQILADDGQPSGARFLVQSPAPGAQLLHAVVATPDGGFTVAWEQYSRGQAIVEARAFFADGGPNGATINIHQTAGSLGEPPSLATLASGDVVVTYGRYVGDITNYIDVFQVRLQPLVRTGRGSDADDQLTGRAGADRLLGLAGDDSLVGGGGDDFLDGGAGWDEAVFAGSAANYKIIEENGVYRIKGFDGFDILNGVEALRFDDRVIDLTLAVCYPPTDAASSKSEGPSTQPADDGESAAPPEEPLVLPGLMEMKEGVLAPSVDPRGPLIIGWDQGWSGAPFDFNVDPTAASFGPEPRLERQLQEDWGW